MKTMLGYPVREELSDEEVDVICILNLGWVPHGNKEIVMKLFGTLTPSAEAIARVAIGDEAFEKYLAWEAGLEAADAAFIAETAHAE